MCLVEIEKNPKLQPSCATPVAQGMVVEHEISCSIDQPALRSGISARQPPLDCPVVRSGGRVRTPELLYGARALRCRFNENKVSGRRRLRSVHYIILDQERCVLCTRCVRFTRRNSKDLRTGVMTAAFEANGIDIFPEYEVTNPYSGNLADICPVGAR